MNALASRNFWERRQGARLWAAQVSTLLLAPPGLRAGVSRCFERDKQGRPRQRVISLVHSTRPALGAQSERKGLGSRDSARERHDLFCCGAFGAARIAVHRSNIREWYCPRPE